MPQHISPAATALHERRGSSSEKFGEQLYFGMSMYARPVHMTTPMGWKIDRSGSKRRFFCGMNSRVILANTVSGEEREKYSDTHIVSIGMLPPTPKPTHTVKTRKVA